jgi:hypothetical protein
MAGVADNIPTLREPKLSSHYKAQLAVGWRDLPVFIQTTADKSISDLRFSPTAVDAGSLRLPLKGPARTPQVRQTRSTCHAIQVQVLERQAHHSMGRDCCVVGGATCGVAHANAASSVGGHDHNGENSGNMLLGRTRSPADGSLNVLGGWLLWNTMPG